MDKFTSNGGVIPDGSNPIYSMDRTGAQEKKFGIYRGIIKDVIHPEDKRNVSGHLEYAVTVLGQEYTGVQDFALGGGIFNSGRRVRRPSSAPTPLSVAPGGYEEGRDGEAVWVLFIGGDVDFPIIIGSDNHPRATENKQRPIPTKADGTLLDFEFNGIQFKVDKESNFTIEHLGRKNSLAATGAALSGLPLNVPGIVENPEAILLPLGPTKINFSGNGDIEFLINETPEFTLKFVKADSKWVLKAGLGLSFTFDGLSDSYEMTTATGTTVSIDGLTDTITAEAAFGDIVEISAANGIQASTPTGTSLSMKAGAVEIDGTAGKLKLSGAQVGLGGPSGELVDLLDQSLAQVDAMLIQLQLETHTGNFGYPTSPPLNAAAYAAIQALVATIKTLVISIKGGI